ncbi:hypothetical protein HNQ53_000947 [Microbulbifer hydrolyticus]|uniref:Uncharacterized protein n=1 Tax=Microbulbifer hydrolyticus TaxID=48074 RepID=A0AA89T3R4_9GAMM|nr:hypothetical protein [Microbulbifer hydrolyticus]
MLAVVAHGEMAAVIAATDSRRAKAPLSRKQSHGTIEV